ncbi:poly [ADP-ribose] polymerase [Plakobranchus ocellatus]|uniref:Poly [ADP-ribose] polymerase n=1 Tax=Plakobranchus ocellatus TaxID=259542 RepID=A0AAV3YJT2_9GAST|nr:poly [ADP-ribose] polymerase [Plakobranchus ocellatus]
MITQTLSGGTWSPMSVPDKVPDDDDTYNKMILQGASLKHVISIIFKSRESVIPFFARSAGLLIIEKTHRKGLLDGCDDWVVSADLPEWERHPDVIRKTALRPDIVIHSASTQQIIMVELTVPYESRMEEAHAFKEAKYLELTKELKKDGYEAKVMPVEIGAKGFVGFSAYGLLSKLSI